MLGLSRLWQRKSRWNHKPAPWFDRPDASKRLEQRRRHERLSEADHAMLQSWLADGYCVVRSAVDEATIDGMTRDMDDVWTAPEPSPGLQILTTDGEGRLTTYTHTELAALEMPKRLQVRDSSRWRVHGFYFHSGHARRVFEHPELIRLASLILGVPAEPKFTINFTYGSEQELHQDTAVFHVAPMNYLVGAWLACEDVSADAGPLVFYPGSHRAPMFEQFDGYPQTNLRTTRDPQAYYSYVSRVSEEYPKRIFLARKGDVFLWHGMLIHGGSPVADPKLTRRSYVCHYIPNGMEVSSEIEGPFNW